MLITSFSSIQSFSDCARQWYLSDYRKLTPVVQKRTGALGFGSRIHSALELWSLANEEIDLIDTWQALSSHEYALMDAAGNGEWDTSELDKETTLGQLMLEGLQDWLADEGEDQEYEVVSVEQKMRQILTVDTPSGPVSVWLYGKLDQLLRHRDTGRLRLRDWKTSKDLEMATNGRLEQSSQVRIYRALLAQEFPELDIDGARYTVLRKVARGPRAKPPFYWNYDLLMSPYNVQAHLTRVASVASKMVTAAAALDDGQSHEIVAPFHVSWRCSSCPYKTACQLWQETSLQAGEAQLEDNFIEHDPLARYQDEEQQAGGGVA